MTDVKVTEMKDEKEEEKGEVAGDDVVEPEKDVKPETHSDPPSTTEDTTEKKKEDNDEEEEEGKKEMDDNRNNDDGEKKKEEEPKTRNDTTDNNNNNNDHDDLIAKVAERLRFFFSDANIRQDRFMRIQLQKPENRGYLPVETLLRFNSIKRLTTDRAVLVRAARHESIKDRIQLSDDQKGVGRITSFTNDQMNDNIDLSLVLFNLPLIGTHDDSRGRTHVPQYSVTHEEVRKLFEPYGHVALVKLRYSWHDPNQKKDHTTTHDNKKGGNGNDDNEEEGGEDTSSNKRRGSKSGGMHTPKGSAFVEFETKEELEKASEELCVKKIGDEEEVEADTEEGKKEKGKKEPKKVLKLGENTLAIITMKEWIENKKKKRQRKHGEGMENGHDKNGEETRKKKRSREDNEEDDDEKEEEQDEEEKAEYNEFKLDWKPGCVISLKGLSEDKCDRESLREAVQTFLGMSQEEFKTASIYVDYSRGQSHGAIRFKEPTDKIAILAEKLHSGDVTIGNEKVESAKVLEGDEETKYWKEFINFKNKQIKAKAEEKASKKKRGKRRRW